MKETLPTVAEAQGRLATVLRALPPVEVDLDAASGCVLAEDVTADRDQPPLPLSAMVHWARGMPTPDLLLAGERYDGSGRLLGFEQLGWSVACDDHRAIPAGSEFRWLPARISAERPGYRVLMVLTEWRI